MSLNCDFHRDYNRINPFRHIELDQMPQHFGLNVDLESRRANIQFIPDHPGRPLVVRWAEILVALLRTPRHRPRNGQKFSPCRRPKARSQLLRRRAEPNIAGATAADERQRTQSFQIILADRWWRDGLKSSSLCSNAATSTAKRSKVFALSPTDSAFAAVPTPCRTEYCRDDRGGRTRESSEIMRG